MKKRYIHIGILISFIFTLPVFADSLPSTDIRFYRPFEPKAEGQVPLQVSETLQGACTQHSTLDNRSDAWHCHANNRMLDPCFIKSYVKTKIAVCPLSPWQSQAVVIQLNPPLPPRNTNDQDNLDMSEDDPWAMDLNNGTHCLKLPVNNTFSVHGQNVKYACDDHGFLLGHIQRCNLIWKMLYLSSRYSNSLKTVEITRAWY